MERLVKGDVVVLKFPFTDLSGQKKRPALVVSTLRGADVILCQITSQQRKDEYAINLNEFEEGGLPKPSFIRTNVLFTGHKELILKKAGKITTEKKKAVQEKIIALIRD